jgi:hypothetical protein
MKTFLSWLVPPYPRSLLALVPAVVVDASLISSSLTADSNCFLFANEFRSACVRGTQGIQKLQIWSVEMISIESFNFSSKKVFLLVLGSLLAGGPLVAPASAQGDSSLWGSVSDDTDAGVAGATIVVRNLETGTERTLTTDVSGHYNASALPVGHYEIAASKAGFQAGRRSSLNAR